MSDNANFGFGKFVPGFEFLQNLASTAVKGATQNIPQLPNMSNWVAPTLSVEDLEKRIEELKSVQFWLDQNAVALKATIQALEVQKMTLATLKGMNFNMGDVANAFKLKTADTVMSGLHKAAETASSAAHTVTDVLRPAVASLAPEPQATPSKPAKPKGGKAAGKATTAGLVDPLQWWGALTEQFQHIAATAVKDAARQTAVDTTRNMAAGVAKEMAKTAKAATQSVAGKAAPRKKAGTATKKATPAKRAAPKPKH
jgi:hypothetical protein